MDTNDSKNESRQVSRQVNPREHIGVFYFNGDCFAFFQKASTRSISSGGRKTDGVG